MLAVPADEEDEEKAHADGEGCTETDADFENGGGEAGDLLGGVAVVEDHLVEGGFGEGMVGWGVGVVEVGGGGGASGRADWGRRGAVDG